MIKTFKDRASADIANGVDSKLTRRRLPTALHVVARIRLAAVDMAESLIDLAAIPSWRLEKLHGDRAGQYSIRINQRYRICFNWHGKNAESVEIVDYH